MADTAELVNSCAIWLLHFPRFPILWTAHCLIQIHCLRCTLKEVKGGTAAQLSKTSPLSCFVLAIIYTFPGAVVSALISSEPPFAVFSNTSQMLVMLAIWYLIFYCPGDLLSRLVDQMPVKKTLLILQDFLRLHLVILGTEKMHNLYPHSLFYPSFYATCSCSSFMFVKFAETAILNGMNRAFCIPHYSTKTCIVASVTMTAQRLRLLPVDIPTQLLAYTAWAMMLRLTYDSDPYSKLEKITCRILFGEATPARSVKQKNS